MDMSPSRPPFSGHFFALETHYFKPFSSFRDPTSNFWQNLVFLRPILPNFGKISAPETYNIQQKFVPETPVSSQKISSGDPTFENLGGTYLPKFLLTTSPGVVTTPLGKTCYKKRLGKMRVNIWLTCHVYLYICIINLLLLISYSWKTG